MAVESTGALNLAFRLLRLTAPSLLAHPPALTHDISDACGFSPLLQLPSGTEIMLGENFSCCMRLTNLSDAALNSIAVKVELQTGRQRVMLLEPSPKPLRLPPGGFHDFLLRHDVKEPGDHVIACSATYTVPDGSPRQEQQTLVFTAGNPLSVRTKTRLVGTMVLLEVCVENTSASTPLFLEYVKLDAHASTEAAQLTLAPDARSSGGDAAALLQRLIDAMLVVQPGGAQNLLYRLQAPPAAAGKLDGKSDLGKLEIKWRRSMGEAGRLQTQHIYLTGTAIQSAVELRLTDLPTIVQLEHPFTVSIMLINNLDRRLGPLQVSYVEALAGAASAFLLQGMLEGAIEDVPPHSSRTVPLTLVPLQPGVHAFSGIACTDASGKPVASLAPMDILVQVDDML